VPEVAEDVGHIRQAADHDAAPGDAFGEVDRLAVDVNATSPNTDRLNPVAVTTMSAGISSPELTFIP